jgi:5-oxoprolinase (ATP-hydrolysing) subunit A
MPHVDLNIDLGELPDEADEFYELATVVNIACGGHAGDEASMRRSVALAKSHGARIAAHPSYPDREQFGRARMPMPLSLLYETIIDQTDALVHVVRQEGATLWGAKPHGALYHAAAEDARIAGAFLDALVAAWPDGLTVVGPTEGHLAGESQARRLAYAREGFADRRYDEEGRLVGRGEPGALLEDPDLSAEQALELARTGNVDTICVHGDTPNSLAIARAVAKALRQNELLRPRLP